MLKIICILLFSPPPRQPVVFICRAMRICPVLVVADDSYCTLVFPVGQLTAGGVAKQGTQLHHARRSIVDSHSSTHQRQWRAFQVGNVRYSTFCFQDTPILSTLTPALVLPSLRALVAHALRHFFSRRTAQGRYDCLRTFPGTVYRTRQGAHWVSARVGGVASLG